MAEQAEQAEQAEVAEHRCAAPAPLIKAQLASGCMYPSKKIVAMQYSQIMLATTIKSLDTEAEAKDWRSR